MLAKRAVQAAQVLQHKKPTSSVDADITGGSTLSSQALPKQEVSTATSKSYTFKAGMMVYFLFLCNLTVILLLMYHSSCFIEQAILSFSGDRVKFVGPSASAISSLQGPLRYCLLFFKVFTSAVNVCCIHNLVLTFSPAI